MLRDFPSKLKCAKIIVIFKDEDDTLPENYRPISLLSIYNRIFEKLMYSRVTKFVKDCNILYDQQYGFRSKHSTQHAILDIVNTILQNMDNGKFPCGVFIDLKKPFDTVNCEILLAKLDNYGIRGVINSWFRSYLTDRKQTTKVNNIVSEAETRGGTWVFFGRVCAARNSKLSPLSKKKFPLKLIPRCRNGPIFYTPF